eukprot:jgi/Tetstr1/436325/TSEL_025163.t1
MPTCHLLVRSGTSDHKLAPCELPDGFLPSSAEQGGGRAPEEFTFTVIEYQRPVPLELNTTELLFQGSLELARFANTLLHGVNRTSEPKAAVVLIDGPTSSTRGYLLPPKQELTAGDGPLQLVLGLKQRIPVPAPGRQAGERATPQPLKRRASSEPDTAIKHPRRTALRTGAVVKDTPALCVARQREIEQLRHRMADLVKSASPLNNRTKTGRFVARDGYFKGLAAMYGRWVFNQKAAEGQGPGLDPLLPSEASVDEQQLPKELVEAGLSRDAALQVSTSLSELSKRAAMRMVLLAESPSEAVEVKKAHVSDDMVELRYAGTVITVTDEHFLKLSNLWDVHAGAGKDGAGKLEDIFCLLQRYEALSGASPGFQMALPEDVFDVLQKHWDVSHECFASPLNCYFPSYCSLFLDTDASFGSKGSFFDFRPAEGSFEANPPFVEDTMTENVRHITELLGSSSSPLSFVIVVPGWDDDSCESYQLTMKSPFLRRHLTLDVRDHYYKNGMQHQIQGGKVYQPSSCATFVFFMQNDAGAKQWPIKESHLAELRSAFQSQSQLRVHQGHRDIIGGASKSWYEDL